MKTKLTNRSVASLKPRKATYDVRDTDIKGFLLRVLITAFSIWVAASIVPGMHIQGAESLLLAAFLLGFVNAIVRPILVFLTFPITLVTLGLFLLLINAGMLSLVAWLMQAFTLDGPLSAFLGALVVSLASGFASKLFD